VSRVTATCPSERPNLTWLKTETEDSFTDPADLFCGAQAAAAVLHEQIISWPIRRSGWPTEAASHHEDGMTRWAATSDEEMHRGYDDRVALRCDADAPAQSRQ
jgi:hypothetical protein